MSEWVSEWVSVSEGAGGGGRRRKADTELKTKTPHVNVGNYISSSTRVSKQLQVPNKDVATVST